MERYIEYQKNLYKSILDFLEGSDEYNNEETIKESFEKIIKIINNHPIKGDADEMRQFLEIIKSIGEHHHRDQHFNECINQLLFHYKDQIKQTLSNSEIFHIFENNKKIVLFLLQKGIITISNEIYKEIIIKFDNNGNRYCYFFLPELEKFVGKEKMKYVKNELLKKYPTILTNYEEKREEGENDSYICSLIRQDLIEEFIKHVNRHNISPSSEILPSIFETNPFLIENKNTTLIEYSAFFGSIQIFQYLSMNNAELTSSLWLYGIHSKNAELIHLIETNEDDYRKSIRNYEKFLIESIRCHHNDIAYYIENNFIDQSEEIIPNSIKYHNYTYFQNSSIIDHGFFYLGLYNYDKLFDFLLKKKKKSIQKKMIQYPDILKASENNEIEVIYYLLLQKQEISKGHFLYSKIKQIIIPSSVTSIGDYAFYHCESLTQISIPSSVTKIGAYSFERCLSLTQITIPSSVTSIGNYAFSECKSLVQIIISSSLTSIGHAAFSFCKSLTQITIPSSITSIGNFVFNGCSSLTKIEIPSSVTSIGIGTFQSCSSLTQIEIPSSVTSIEKSAFSYCSSLTQIKIPSSLNLIGDHAFSYCSSLTQITIPSSVISIENNSFKGCLSLKQIIIPSSVTSIEDFAFEGCSSLTQITIPSSVISIGNDVFTRCSSLKQITIPSSVISIGNSAFSGCSSLTQITIPSSVTSIGKNALSYCRSLTQIEIPSSLKLNEIRLNSNAKIIYI